MFWSLPPAILVGTFVASLKASKYMVPEGA